jgi:hypothetical protein
VCTNFTWSSRNYQTDQVIISRDAPCTAVMPGTSVESAACDPATSFQPGTGQPIYIGIYGYASTQFTILVAPVGQSVQLLAGQPQLSRTSLGFICTSRSQVNGVCLPTAADITKVEVAYFSFRVSPSESIGAGSRLGHRADGQSIYAPQSPERDGSQSGSGWSAQLVESGNQRQAAAMAAVFDVIISVQANCNFSSPVCVPGCDCAPLTVLVNSCPLSRCTQTDRRPSQILGQFKTRRQVDAREGVTLFLSSSNGFCDPAVAKEECAYFVAVVAAPLPSPFPNVPPKLDSAAFSLTARTPGDVILIPCVSVDPPDGACLIIIFIYAFIYIYIYLFFSLFFFNYIEIIFRDQVPR